MIDVIRNPRNTILILAILISLAWCVAGLAGCNGNGLGDYITVRTPTTLARRLALPLKMSLNDARVKYPLALEEEQAWFSDWAERIEGGASWETFAQDVLAPKILAYGQAAATGSGVPWLAPLLVSAAGLGGIIVKSPGEEKRQKAAEDKGWDGAIMQTMAILGLKVPPVDLRSPPPTSGVA